MPHLAIEVSYIRPQGVPNYQALILDMLLELGYLHTKVNLISQPEGGHSLVLPANLTHRRLEITNQFADLNLEVKFA